MLVPSFATMLGVVTVTLSIITIADSSSLAPERSQPIAPLRDHKLLKKQLTQQVPTTHVHVQDSTSILNFRPNIRQLGRAISREQLHTVVIAVKQNGLDELKNILYDVSNPNSANYGLHLSRDEVLDITSNAESVNHIETYLREMYPSVNIVDRTLGGEYLIAEAPLETWEALLDTQFFEYTNTDTDQSFTHTTKYSLPSVLVDHVHAVYNVADFLGTAAAAAAPSHKKLTSSASNEGGVLESGYVTPQFINDYNLVFNNTGSLLASQAIFAAANQSYSPSDLTDFQTYFELPIESVAYDVNGHVADNACVYEGGADCIEANLDVQYMMGNSQKTPTTFYYNYGDWITFLTGVANMTNPPLVFSISYVGMESQIASSYMDSFNAEALKVSAMGVSIVTGSGDDGVAGYLARYDPQYCGYYPMFPDTSEYVVSVGGTQGPESGNPEVACLGNLGGIITTGGGFSNIAGQPSWQADGVAAYFAAIENSNGALETPAAGYNAAGYGYPDVAGLAFNFQIFSNGQQEAVSGTSASTPIFASMLSLVNAARLEANKSSLGWIIPSLWELHDSYVLVDITNGVNNCGALGVVCCEQGFTAAEGWDPVTGWGSINYTAFYETFFTLGDSPNMPTAAPSVIPGSPTEKPVAAPTVLPSAAPTAVPTVGAGFLYYVQYSDATCDSAAAVVESIPTGICMPVYSTSNTSGVVAGYVQYSCGASTAYTNYYTDSSCSSEFLYKSEESFLGCATVNPVDDSLESFGYSAMCTDTVTDLPISSDSNYITITYFDDNEGEDSSSEGSGSTVDDAADSTSCISKSISSVITILEWHCFTTPCEDDSGNTCSYLYMWPYLNTYDGSDCDLSSQSSQTKLSTDCTAVTQDTNSATDQYDYYYYYDDVFDSTTEQLYMQYGYLDFSNKPNSSDDDDSYELSVGLGVGFSFFFLIVIGGLIAYKTGCLSSTGTAGGKSTGFARGDTLQKPLTNRVAGGMGSDSDGYI